MDYFATRPQFASLSLIDLLRARDQFHPHLMHKANVVGTAVGRYRIRKADPYPKDDEEAAVGGPRAAKGTQTLENSEVRSYSWPCVLVFVSRWQEASELIGRGGAAASNGRRSGRYSIRTSMEPSLCGVSTRNGWGR